MPRKLSIKEEGGDTQHGISHYSVIVFFLLVDDYRFSVI